MKLFKYAIHILILGILLLVFYNCPFRFFLGISCLGCGMTRGLLCALRFQFQKAFYYHPLFWIVPLYVIGALLDYFCILKLSSKTKNIIYTITIFLFIIAYLFRLFHGHEAVNWNVQDGLLYQLIIKKFL